MVERISELEYLKKTGWQKFTYKVGYFFKTIPQNLKHFFTVTLVALLLKLWLSVKGTALSIVDAVRKGDWKTRTGFVVMGFSQLARGQIMRGGAYLVFEILFILYMLLFGGAQLAQFGTLGTVERHEELMVNDKGQEYYGYVDGDNSQLILLYGLLTIIFIIGFAYAWYKSIKGGYNAQIRQEAKQHLETAKEDLQAFADDQYHKTLLSLPLLGLVIFTIFPIIFMIFIAFTNYDDAHMPPANLFTWIGWSNFKAVFSGGLSGNIQFGRVFGQVLLWTVIWAFFATFSNYIVGMIVALLINKKGIRLKKLWRTVLIMTIAVPQFISLMLMSQMLGDYGIINTMLQNWGITKKLVPFLTHKTVAKVTLIVVNMWVGIPYTMLMVSGILMNIPEDLYESARIDGAGPVKAYFKITLPYVIHVTTPYLITSFIGNLNNFGVIFLLTGGAPLMSKGFSGGAGETDLLITWLYKLVMDKKLYGMASVISILMFILTAVISLIVYNRSKAVKNEEDFM